MFFLGGSFLENPSFWAIFLSPGDSDGKKYVQKHGKKLRQKTAKSAKWSIILGVHWLLACGRLFSKKGTISSFAPFWTMKLPKRTENTLGDLSKNHIFSSGVAILRKLRLFSWMAFFEIFKATPFFAEKVFFSAAGSILLRYSSLRCVKITINSPLGVACTFWKTCTTFLPKSLFFRFLMLFGFICFFGAK